MKRPLGIVALLYLGGLLLGYVFQPPLGCLVPTCLAFAAATLLLRRFRFYLVRALIVLVGWTNLVWHTAVTSPTDLRSILTDKPELTTVRGNLIATPTERAYVDASGIISFHTTARVNVSGLLRGTNWTPATGAISVATPGRLPAEFFRGQQVEIYGVLAPPPTPLAEGLFDFRAYLRQQDMYFELKTDNTEDWHLVSKHHLTPPLSDRFKKWAESALALGMQHEDQTVHLQQAVTLGDKTFLTEHVTEPFLQASTYHIFAVDGLRMAIIFGLFFKALRLLRVPRLVSGGLLIPLIWFYVALTGWPASAIRASVMLTIVIAGWMLRRPPDILNSLYAAALIILLWQPQQLFQTGFQLSFFVVLCILLMTPQFDRLIEKLLRPDPLLPDELRPRWQRLLHGPTRLALALCFSSFAAWIGSIPLVAYYFHIVTPISTPANVVAVPLCVLVLAGNLITLVLAAWFPGGAWLFNHVTWILMNWIQHTSEWFAQWPHAYSYVAAPTHFGIATYYAILIAVLTGWIFRPARRRWRVAGLILLVTVWCSLRLYDRAATRITVLPVDGGSSVFCDPPGSDNVLIDCGPRNSIESVMKPYLRGQGVNSLPVLTLTVGASQQVSGFEKLQALMPIQTVITGSAHFRSPDYRTIVESLDKTPGRRQIVTNDDRIGDWTVLCPGETNHFSLAEDNALALRGEFHGVRVLLLSDLGRQGQEALLNRGADLCADVVVAGLPEQSEPLSNALLDAIHPRLIVIADSERPAARRASRELHSRLHHRGIPVIYTRTTQAVKLTIRQNKWKVTSVDGVQLASGVASR